MTRLGLSSPHFRALAVAACLLAGWMYLGRSSRAEELPPREPLTTLPLRVDSWTGRNDVPLADDILQVLGVDDYVTRVYSRAQSLPVGLYVGFYRTQRQGDTIHSPLNCLPGAGWEPLEVGRLTVDVRSSPTASTTRSIEVNRVLIGKGLERQLVLTWYQSRDRVVASEYWGKVYTVLDAVKYNRTDAALIRVIVPVPDQGATASADRVARDFVEGLFPLLGRHIPA